MNVDTIGQSAAIVLALVASGGLGLQQQRVAALRQDRDDEKARSAGLRDDLVDLEKERDEERQKTARLTSDLRHAEALALRESHWVQVVDALTRIEQALSRDKQ